MTLKEKRKIKVLFILIFYLYKKLNKIKMYQDKPYPVRKSKFYFDYSKIRVDKKVLVIFE